jgi:hypothetical protein
VAKDQSIVLNAARPAQERAVLPEDGSAGRKDRGRPDNVDRSRADQVNSRGARLRLRSCAKAGEGLRRPCSPPESTPLCNFDQRCLDEVDRENLDLRHNSDLRPVGKVCAVSHAEVRGRIAGPNRQRARPRCH